MQFPLSGPEVTVAIPYLLLLGFTVGACSGFWGVGGGWIIVPALWMVGVPREVAIGSSLAFITAQSVVAASAHARLGNVDFKLGLLLAVSSVVGVELGTRAVQSVKSLGKIDIALDVAYALLLGGLAALILLEAAFVRRKLSRRGGAGDLASQGLARRLHHMNLPPQVSLPKSGVERISLWLVLGLGLLLGTLAGFLGVGGGFAAVPAFIYVVGTSTHIAVGTSLFTVLLTASFGTLTHGTRGNVDIILALVMLPTAAVGAQIGSFATAYVRGVQIRLMYGVALLAAFASIAADMLGAVNVRLILIMSAACLLSLVVLFYFIRGMLRARNKSHAQR